MTRKHLKMKSIFKEILCMLLVVALVPVSLPPLPVAAAVDDSLVTSLAEVYGGDEERARADLETLRAAGIINDDGSMVALDIREDGAPVTLSDLQMRIASGESVGDITVNGHEATTEQILQIAQVKSALEIIRLLDQDIEITDEHVNNLESLLEAIADGSIDLEEVLASGNLSTESLRGAAPSGIMMLGNPMSGPLRSSNTGGLPDTATATGTAVATDGKYVQPLVNDIEYDSNYEFELPSADNAEYYTDSRYEGAALDGVISFSCANTANASNNGTNFTVTASLNKAQVFPVSFDWYAAGGVEITGTQRGTVTWNAGQTGNKTFTVKVKKENDEYWKGKRAFTICAGNFKNAVPADGGSVWCKNVLVSANDGSSIEAESDWTNISVTIPNPINGSGFNDRNKKTYNITFPNAVSNTVLKMTFRYRYKVQDPATTSERVLYQLLTTTQDFLSLGSMYTGSQLIQSGGTSSDYTETTKTMTHNIGSTSSYNKLQVGFIQSGGSSATTDYGELLGLTVAALTLPLETSVANVSVPAGTYYTGQTVPVTITMSEYVKSTADTKLLVNGVECELLDEAGTEAKTLTFGYTVRDVDTGSINVTGFKDGGQLKNHASANITVTGQWPTPSTFGSDAGVTLTSDVKRASLDTENIKYGINDADAGEQVVTVMIPLTGSRTWLANEMVEIDASSPMEFPLPGYPNATVTHYLSSAYFSQDNGQTRYPVYIVNDGTSEAVALAGRLAAPVNPTALLRKDRINLFLDSSIVSEEDKYVGGWESKSTDAAGYAYFTAAEGADAATAVPECTFTYYVKGGIVFEADGVTSRGAIDYTDHLAAGGYLRLDDGNYVKLQDADDPANQYDVEIIANSAFYNAAMTGVRTEEQNELQLSYQVSNRKDFTFTDPRFFTWTSSNEDVLRISKDSATGAANLVFTGNSGEADITLTVGNGSERKKYDLPSLHLVVLGGMSPFLNIPDFSQVRTTLTGADTDVLFASNLTARNAEAGVAQTPITVKLFGAVDNAGTYEKTGDALWETTVYSTTIAPATHVRIPGGQILQQGLYAVEISAGYAGGNISGVNTAAENFTATAYLIVKQPPAKVSLNRLESYSVMHSRIPAIGYTVAPSGATVEYTVQKSGSSEITRNTAAGGVIPFAPARPAGLKDAYVITVYARNNMEEAWSSDSMLLTVYNDNALDLIVADAVAGEIGGTTGGSGNSASGATINMDNREKLSNYGVSGDGYQLSFNDFNSLRTDMSLQKIISANYGTGTWGLLSDKLQWASGDSSLVSVNYEQGGIYSDIRDYSYTSYVPSTDFLLVGKGDTDVPVTVSAIHAGTGMSATVSVTARTLKDKLYVFQFYPAATTKVVYTNGSGDRRILQSNDKGELAVYEPEGIASAVMTMSESGGKTYVGTLFNSELATGEKNIAALQLYPCNNLRLRSISNATLTFNNPDGTAYSGEVTLRAGVYKNGTYCPEAKVFLSGDTTGRNGREDINATVSNGKLSIGFDPTQFKIDPANAGEEGIFSGDSITYVFEYRITGCRPGYVLLNTVTDQEGSQLPTDSVVNLRRKSGGDNSPQIVKQTIRQYFDGEAVPYSRDVMDYTENIGVSNRFSKVDLHTEAMLLGENVTSDARGYSICEADDITSFAIYKTNGRKLTGQSLPSGAGAVQLVELAALSEPGVFVFPFSSLPVAHSVYEMTDENMKADGISDEGEDCLSSSRVMLRFTKNGMTVKSETMPFGVSNLSHQVDLMSNSSGIEEIGNEVKEELGSNWSIGAIFNQIDVNDMLRKGFVFLGKMMGEGGENMIHMMILPTEDPGRFRIMAFVGYNKREHDNGANPSLNYDANKAYDDVQKFQKELEKLGKDDKKKNKKDESHGEGKAELNFYGTVILEAGWNESTDSWGVDFCGGNVGANFVAKYEWSNTFMCGPYPILVEFGVKGTTDVEVAFANKEAARAMLMDVAVGVSMEAFAGLGFDLSIVAFKLGIFGEIGADVNFLYLTRGDQTGTKLGIAGEIGLRMEAKLLLLSYKKTFCSTGFNWTRKWDNYDRIKEQWENDGYADLVGVTQGGRNYVMRLYPYGAALVAIDGEGEIENRDYLELADRAWYSGTPARRGLLKAAGPMTDAMNEVQSNAYPYSNPVFANDGEVFIYISDNDNADAPETVASYAVKNGSGYENRGPIVTSAGNILADSDVVASGRGTNTFAAWIKQQESPKKEMHDTATYDDLGMMMNATEIYAGKYNGSSWAVERLTTNNVADMSPAIASYGNRAIVAWRSLSATEMPAEGSSDDLTAMFNAENNLCYRIYNGSNWEDAVVAYNGATGTVNAVDVAMNVDGSAVLVYTVRTGEGADTTETFYTVVGESGNPITTGRLTNDSYTDINAKAVALGSDFILGWYSEHESGETGLAATPVTAHDIRVAKVFADGSVDAAFPESVGGSSSSNITRDFRFSSPANMTDISQLSIVWSQPKDSELASDAGKYQLNAVRFYEEGGIVGVTPETDIAETTKNFTIDHFDTYTDSTGKVYAVILGSDYSSVNGISFYDSIDLTNLPVDVTTDSGENAEHLAILSRNPVAAMKLASGTFEAIDAETSAETNLYELTQGMNLPVQIGVKNIGTDVINTVAISMTGVNESFTGLSILPGQSMTFNVAYPVPEGAVGDVAYTVTANGNSFNGTLILNRPDVGITKMSVVREEGLQRDVRLTIGNSTGIPLSGSGKTVKLAYYKDSRYLERVGNEVTIPSSAYADIDDDLYTRVDTLNVRDFKGTEVSEIPDGGVRIYAKVWIEDVDELYPEDNIASTVFTGLIKKYETVSTMDTALLAGENGEYTVSADIRNNSLQTGSFGDITADILDAENHVLKSVPMISSLSLTGEASRSLTASVSDLEGTPASVSLRSSLNSVVLDAETNGGSCELHSISLTKDGTLPGNMPVAEKSGSTFIGWFTEPSGGEEILADTVIKDVVNLSGAAVSADNPMTIYAQFGKKSSQRKTDDTVKVEVSGDEGTVSVNVSVKNGTAAVVAPTAEQMAEILDKNKSTGSVVVDVSGIGEKITAVSIPTETIKAFDNAIEKGQQGLMIKMPNNTVTFDPTALSAIAAEANGPDLVLSVETVSDSKINEKQRDAIAELDVLAIYDVYLSSGGKRISNFGGGNANVRVMYKIKEGQKPGAIIVWYVAENGEKTKVPTIATNSFVTWTAGHFSNYVVAYDETQSGVCPQDETCPMASYGDLNLNGWYHDGIHFALENGIMTGTGKTTFAPADKTNRAMMAQILWNMEDGATAGYDISYTDVPETAWFAKAVRWASGVGIMEGYGEGMFGPNDNLTREQLVTILYRYAKSKDASFGNEKASLSSYTDASSLASWASEAMSVMVAKGIITGRSETKLAPKESASRAEIATIVMRYFMGLQKKLDK